MASKKRERKREGAAARRAALEAARKKQQRKQQSIRIGGLVGIVLLVALVVTVVASRGGGSSDDAASTTTTIAAEPTSTVPAVSIPKAPPVAAGASIKGDTPCPKADGSSPRTSSFEKAPPASCTNAKKKYTATFDTTEGKFVVALDQKAAPGAVNNFVVLSRYHYYDGTSIFRTDTSIDIFQGGAPSQTNADPGPGYTIPDEGGKFTYTEGDLVMARTGQPNSTGAQFFVGTGPKISNLDGQGTYLKLGKITEGLDVAKKIQALNLDDPSSQLGGAPSKIVLITTITITES